MIKATNLWILDRTTETWVKTLELAQTMIGKEPRFNQKRIEEKLFKSPWGSYIEQQDDNGLAKYYWLNASCELESIDDRHTLESNLLMYLIK